MKWSAPAQVALVIAIFLLAFTGECQTTVTNLATIQAGSRGGLYTANVAPLQPSPLIRLPIGSIHPQGWLLALLQAQRNGLIGNEESLSPYLQFTNNDWITTNGSGACQGGERVPYWLRGYLDMGYCLQDPTVISNATRWIKGVMLSQRTNGYFGPATLYGDAQTTSDLGINGPDLWPAMPMLNVFRSYYDFTGDTNALNLLERYASWENSMNPTNFASGVWPTMRMGDNIESVLWLYNRVGQPWLLTLATNMYANMARWDNTNYMPTTHNVNIAEGFRTPAVFWQQSGNPVHLQFAEYNYQMVKQQYGQVPGGAFGADESFRGMFYGPRQAFETCGWVEFMRSFEILTRVTGNPVWAERCEDVAANSFPAALTTNMTELRYLTAPNQPQSDDGVKVPDINNGGAPWFSFSPNSGNYICCEHNHGMGWPYFCEETWLATWDDGLCASLYAPTIVTARVNGGASVTVAENTTYPFSDTVQLTVSATNNPTFPLYLRIPQWSSNSWLTINGVLCATNCQPSSYLCLQRTWANGDSVLIHFPRHLSLHTWALNNNSVSLNYGPLTFSLQIGENWQPYGGNAAPWTELQLFPSTPWNYGLDLDTNNPAAAITIITNPAADYTNPFSLQTVPIKMLVKAREIPAWTLDNVSVIGPVQPSPVFTTQSQETVTLVPMGAARLRVSAVPIVSTNPAATMWSAPYNPNASFFSSDSLSAMNDAIEPVSSHDTTIPRFTWWPHTGTTEWVTASFNGLSRVSQASVYWYDDDVYGGGTRVPRSWNLQYLAGTNWVNVTTSGGYGVLTNQFNTVQFSPVQTTTLRLMAQLQSSYSAGILELQVPAEPVSILAVRYSLNGDLLDSVSGQDGTLSGGNFTAGRPGSTLKALQFNGSSDFAVINRPNWLDWTIACWIKTTNAAGTGTWRVGKGIVDGSIASSADDFGLALVGNAAAFGVGNPDTTILSTSPINDGYWHHLAAVRNATTGSMQLYVDGVLQAATNGPLGSKFAPPVLRLGSLQTGAATGYLAGSLQDVQIFNRALSGSEINSVISQTITLIPFPGTNAIPGQTVTISNSVVDPYSPPNALLWELLIAPAGTAIDPLSGIVTWQPAISQANSSNAFTILVADLNAGLAAIQTYPVMVGNVSQPWIQLAPANSRAMSLQIAGPVGSNYVIEAASNLASPATWQPLITNPSAATPFIWTDPDATNYSSRYYRVRLLP